MICATLIAARIALLHVVESPRRGGTGRSRGRITALDAFGIEEASKKDRPNRIGIEGGIVSRIGGRTIEPVARTAARPDGNPFANLAI